MSDRYKNRSTWRRLWAFQSQTKSPLVPRRPAPKLKLLGIVLSTVPLLLGVIGLSLWRQARMPNTPLEGIAVNSYPMTPPFWIAEVLDLSVDQPTSMACFDVRAAEQKLLATQIFTEVEIRMQRPNLLKVRLIPRIPVAEIGDFSRTGMDKEGWLFPLDPIYACYTFPKIYLGEQCPNAPWGKCLQHELVQCMHPFLQRGDLCFLDLSKSKASSLGQRVCVLGLINGDLIHCAPDTVYKQLHSYDLFVKHRLPHPAYIDLRVEGALFVYLPSL